MFFIGFSIRGHRNLCFSRSRGIVQLHDRRYLPFSFKLIPYNIANEFGEWLYNSGLNSRIYFFSHVYNRNVYWDRGRIYFKSRDNKAYLNTLETPTTTLNTATIMEYSFRYINHFGLFYENSTGKTGVFRTQ